MRLTKKISRLRDLESIQPDKRWEKTTKYDLLEEISSQNRLMQAYKLSTSQKIDLFVMKSFNRVAPSLTKALTAFLVFMMFFGMNIAAQASVPGQPLWPVKRAVEEGEVLIAFSPVKKTEVHIKHVNERLDEIEKILEQDIAVEEVEVQVEQDIAIKQAVSHLEQDIASVDSALQIVKEEKEAIEVVELVKKVTSVTKEAIIDLETQIEDTDSLIIEEALDGAKEANTEVKEAAVDLAIEVHDEIVAAETLAAETLVAEENIILEEVVLVEVSEELEAIKVLVAEIVAEQIEDLSEQIDTTKEDVDNVVEEALIELVEVEENKETAEGSEQSRGEESIEVIEDIDNIKENPEEAAVVLDEAKVLLEEGSFKEAIDKIDESKELNDKSEVILEKLDELQEVEVPSEEPVEDVEPITEVLPEVTTSTQNLDIKPEDEETIESSGIDIVEDPEQS
ncbi:MAG: hypothetical protein HOE19_00110 [Candidatus Komeilibacteria bacterium]|jgi:hypothetical protein|nr:hypothetical protein [Candidatus Komeilibacteria bacterium]MBT4448011.1 hypothetical protein [Candidatus Komeilibacteria bacterium]